MKVSNNALNFLLAQYRAIFKRAYIKGLASAVLLTAGLAASQAQAATDMNALASGGVITATDSGTYINISGSGSGQWNADVTIVNGAPSGTANSGNFVIASGGALTLEGTGSLTINVTSGDVASGGMLVQGGGSGSVTISLSKIDVTRGTLDIKDGNASGGATVSADVITIGSQSDTDATTRNGVVKLSTASGAAVTFGATDSKIDIYADGQLETDASSGAATINGAYLALHDGALLKLSGASGTTLSTDLNVDKKSAVVVAASGSGTFTGATAQMDGNLLVVSGATLNLNPSEKQVEGVAQGEQVTFGDSANVQIGGTLNLNAGTLTVENDASLHASDQGAIKVTGSGDDTTTLKIESSTLKNFLTANQPVTSIAADGKISSGNSASGGILLSGAKAKSNVVLEFTDQGQVNLSDFTFSSGSTASGGKINIDASSSGSTIVGRKLAVTEALDEDVKLDLQADTLTLGSSAYTSAGADLKFDSATAKNLTLVSNGSGFGLKNAVTLDVTLGNDEQITDEDGMIKGSLVLADSTSGTLTVKHGSYTLEGDLTISGGKLDITNEDRGDAGNLDTALVLDRQNTFNYHNASGSTGTTITVGPATALSDAQTILDISEATLNVTNGNQASGTITVQNGGILRLAGEQLQDLADDTPTSGTAIFAKAGTIDVVDNLSLKASQLQSGTTAADKKITFSGASTLNVGGTLDLSAASTALNLGADTNIKAETLKLTNSTESAGVTTYNAVTLQSGKYTALKALTSESASTEIQVSGASVYLGAIAGDGTAENPYSALSSTGTIGAKLTVNDTNSIVEVAAGRWSATSDIAVSAGKLTIGELDSADVAKTDAQGNAITASLSANKLTLGAANAAEVTSVGSLTVKDLTASAANALEVAGTVTVSGVYDDNDTTNDATDDTYGVNLAASSVHVGTGAKVTFGEDATAAITVSETADQNSKKYLTIADDTFTGKVFTVDAAGEVEFSFDADTVFTKESIAEFRDTLFNYDTSKDVIDGFINLGEAEIKGLAVADDGTVAWDTLSGYTDILADVTTKDLAEAKVTGITDGANVRGNLGSLVTKAGYVGDSILVDGNLTLNNAAGNNGAFASTNAGALLDLEVTAPANVVLNNGGKVGAITFAEGDSSLTVSSNQGTTEIESVDGAEADLSITTGAATIGATTVATLTTAAGTETTFTGAVEVGNKASSTEVSSVAGTTIFKDEAIFAQGVTFAGTATFDKTATFEGAVAVNGGTTTVQDEASLEQGATIINGGTFKAGAITLSSTTGTPYVLGVGTEGTTGTTTGTGYLETESLTLAGNDLVVDPAYGDKTSIAAIKGFDDAVNSDVDAGTVDGRIFVGQNAALDVGTSASIAHMQEFLEHYQGSNGSLVADEVGSIMYLSDKLTVKDGGRIILDSTRGQTELLTNAGKVGAYGVNNTDADLYLGKHTVLAIGDGILEDGAAIHFDKNGAGIMAEDGSATIVLDGDKFLNSRSITLFTDNDGTGVMVLGDQDIRVETLNGVMYFEYEAGKETTAQTLKLDTYKIDSAYRGATEESRQLLLAYASRTANFAEYYDPDNQALLNGQTPSPAAEGEKTTTIKPVDREALIAGEASRGEAYWDSTNGLTVTSSAQQAGLTADDFHVEEIVDEETGAVVDHVVYRLAHNEFLEAVARNTDGRALDGAALQGVFGGSAQAALLAARTSQDAIAGRTGVGASSSALTFADNGQGGGVWVAPIYVSQDSDGFAVDTKDYGVDIDLYGVALGGDYTMGNGLRLGAFFNVGSGDVDGSGQASGVSNDFNYYGLGLYAGYNVGAFSLVGDLSYTVVDSDVEASTSVGKLSSSFDTDNFSVGVTGQYQLAFGATTVTPHAGLRFSSISIDDYRIETGYADGGNFDSDSANVFSIPVGVTIAQEFSAGSWQVKPSFDLTLTGNFGDDEIEATTNWDGVANWQSSYNAEFVDNFTYGATLGIAAQSGAFSLGVGISYTGSENVDEFGATANARFTF